MGVRALLVLSVCVVACGKPMTPAPPVRSCESVIRFVSDEPTISIRGEWNGFTPVAMTKASAGVFEFRQNLEYRTAGYAYRFQLPDAGELMDPAMPFTRWVGTTEHSRLEISDCVRPIIEVSEFTADSAGNMKVAFAVKRNAGGVLVNAPVFTLDGQVRTGAFSAATGVGVVTATALSMGKHTAKISLSDVEGHEAEPVYLPFWVEAKPFTFEGSLMYFVFTDRFRNGVAANDAASSGVNPKANYQGGDFRGVTAAINEGYFDTLGVQVLWLSPPEANPDEGYPGTDGNQYSGYHGYWPMAPRQVQRRFGSTEDLRELVKAAHARGIRVITDLVLNHVHEKHPWYTQHRDDDWFNTSKACVCGAPGCDWDTQALTCWFTSYLPDLNWKNAQMADAFTADAKWWLSEIDVDGFRLDAVKHLERTGTRAIRGTVNGYTKLTGAPYYLVGETFTSVDGRELIKSYIGPQLLDGQFDFPLYWVTLDVFARGQSFRQLETAMQLNASTYAPGTLNSPFLGNHDVPRFSSTAAGQIESNAVAQAWNNPPPATVETDEPFFRAKLGFTFLLGQPGLPLIYYGDEIGLPGAGDPDNRRFMKWSNLSPRESDLLAFMQKLGTARRDHPALHAGQRSTLFVDDELMIMQRVSEGRSALIVINRGSARQQNVTPNFGTGSHTLRDIFTGQTLTVNGTVGLQLPARSIQVWVD